MDDEQDQFLNKSKNGSKKISKILNCRMLICK